MSEQWSDEQKGLVQHTHIYIAVPPRYPYYLRGCITLPHTPHSNNLQLRHGQNKIKQADSRITNFQIILQLGSDSAGDIGLNTTTNKTGLADNKVDGNFVSSMNCKYQTLETISQVIPQIRKLLTNYFFTKNCLRYKMIYNTNSQIMTKII